MSFLTTLCLLLLTLGECEMWMSEAMSRRSKGRVIAPYVCFIVKCWIVYTLLKTVRQNPKHKGAHQNFTCEAGVSLACFIHTATEQ
jgi:hypothetical protein